MRWLVGVAVVSGLLACNAIVGFDDLTKEPAAPSDDPDPIDPKRDSGSKSDASSGGDDDDASTQPAEDAGDGGRPVASTECPGTPPAAGSYPPWVSPSARARPCKSADLDSFLANEARPYDEQRATMAARNSACASCVFTEQSQVWGPIVHLDDGRIFHGFAICYRLAGASEACAKAAHALEWCSEKVCNVCSSGLTMADCQARARTNDCQQFADDTIAACQSFGTILNSTCARSGNVVSVICGGL